MPEVEYEKAAPEEMVAPEPTAESLVEGQDPVKSDQGEPTIAEKIEGLKTAGTEIPEEQPDAWKPNYKLRVLDEDKEIEEWARPLVNKGNEKQVRELFEKAYAADHMKVRRDEATTKAQQFEQKLQGYVEQVQKVRSVADKDFGSFLKQINYSPQQVMAWVRKQLERQEFLQRDDIPQEVKQAFTQQEEQQQRALDLEEQNQALQGQHVDSSVLAKSNELNQQLGREDVRTFAESFDQRLAKPGAFREFVIQHAANVWTSSKGTRDLTGEEAVNETLRLLGHIPSPGGNAGVENPKPNATPNAPKVVTAQPKATVIPNVGSGSTAAMGKKPKSLDDLRRMAKEARQ